MSHQDELRQAIQELSDRCLHASVKWAAELLYSECVPDYGESDSAFSAAPQPHTPLSPALLLAKSYFDSKEFRRCAHVLRAQSDQHSVFLRGYALFMAGEKQKEEELFESHDLTHAHAGTRFLSAASLSAAPPPVDPVAVSAAAVSALIGSTAPGPGSEGGLSVVAGGGSAGTAAGVGSSVAGSGQAMRVLQLQRGQNREARSILTSLTTAPVSNTGSATPAKAPALDGYLYFLQALCLHSLGHSAQAIQACVNAVNDKPLLWSAWKLLVTLCSDRDIINGLQLNKHWARLFFDAEVALEAQQTSLPTAANSSTSYVEDHFPKSTHTLACRAVVAYNNRDFDTAQTLFETLRERDPHRLEQMDTFSNILYIREQRPSLSFLAHAAHKEDKYRPETCCIVGNYYSLKGDHEKALVYFRRALRLNPNYLAAWTLMGHEFVELRNTPAAIEAYRCAVDINARDYRAWYGLGQTYEILQMHSHSLFYFSKAAALRPYDPRLWCALAESFEKLDRIDDAIKCYLRAEGNQDREGIALLRLAKLHAQLSGFENRDKAAEYYKRVLSRDQGTHHNISGSDAIEARMFLAQHARNRGKFDEAITLCQELMDCGGATRDAAKVLLSEVRQMMTSK